LYFPARGMSSRQGAGAPYAPCNAAPDTVKFTAIQYGLVYNWPDTDGPVTIPNADENLSLEFLFGSNLGFSRILESLSSAHRMHDFTDFRQPNCTKFEHNTSIGVGINPSGIEFWKFSLKGSFFQKTQNNLFFQRLATSGRHNSTVIIDRQKFITKWSLYGIPS